MPREGIRYELVAAEADRQVSQGINPSIESIRRVLGGGSNTIHRHLKKWRENRPQEPVTLADVPLGVAKVWAEEITKAKSEGRAEGEGRLAVCLEDLDALSENLQKIEDDNAALLEKLDALARERDGLRVRGAALEAQVERLTGDLDRERHVSEQARTETAQTRNKLDDQAQKITDLVKDIENMRLAYESEIQSRIKAEKDLAVASAKLESEQEKSQQLFVNKELLIEQLDVVKESCESAKITNAKLTRELELLGAALIEKTTANRELDGFWQAERNCRFAAEQKIAAMEEKLLVGRQG